MTFMEMMASLVFARGQVVRLEAALGITADEAATLLAIATGQRPSTLAELAHRLDFPQPRVARMVRTLVQNGWAELEPDPVDRRQVRVHLTAKGSGFLQSLHNPAAAETGRSNLLAGVAAREAG